jgi:acetyltransferase-like isoleucine patch superfamily enzyme
MGWLRARVKRAPAGTRARAVKCALIVVLPQRLKHLAYRRLLGFQIADSARIGLSYIDVEHLSLGEHVYVGHFNIFRAARLITLGDNVHIANYNHFFGRPADRGFEDRSLGVGEGTLIMSRHFFDLSGTVEIGRGCTIGGRDSHFWSHSLRDIGATPTLTAAKLVLGDGVYTGARVTVVHCQVPAGATIGAGAVVTRTFADEARRIVIAGNPARVIPAKVDAGEA